MAHDAVLRELRLQLPLEPDMEIEASRTAAAMAEGMEMGGDKIDEVRLAVVEACINAYEYSRSKDGQVHLLFEVLGGAEPEALRITVEDRGVGFDPDAVEEPRRGGENRLPKKRGWGLKIIHSLMDEVEIDSGSDGTRLVMSKSR